ncbi:Tex family protein [Veillonella criceti]|uniref:30S ribosomal protein S1 n=1 Tax=Veillonella criceti TaxID=103891 RepID=A0A380NP88_9FIRM|nr:Tex family protein [Veillonella criceti]SUP44856.1 30S ribosomal protein S1 [Veillonella criceti]
MLEKMSQYIATELGVKGWQVKVAVELLDEGNTVPFIARYRKEKTGELKDEQLREIEERIKYLRNLEQRREEIVRSITEQEKMTPELATAIEGAMKLQELEDLYLPYRPKKRTRASIAREQGLEPLAAMIVSEVADDIAASAETLAQPFITDEVPTIEAAWQGAMDIVAEDVSDRADFRAYLREAIWRDGKVKAVLVDETDDNKEVRQGFLQYENHEEAIHQMPSHRILAINRGEKLGVLKVTITAPDETYIAYMLGKLPVPAVTSLVPYKELAVADAYKRLIFPAMEREIRKTLTENADEQAIKVFGTNLRNLLLQPPLAGHVIMGLDPGYRMGCKMAIIDAQGNVLDQGIYHLTAGEKGKEAAKVDMAHRIRKWKVTLLSIGNGTASYETEQFVSQLIEAEKLDCHYIITNEAGASVYSASKLAIEELPDLDVSIRGAVSIARRVQDPLAESVKIDPKSIGVGQYQHDVNQKQLSATLDQVVETVVNHVGVELNTASPAILQHVAGISSAVANNIVAYRKDNGTFHNRKELLKVKRLGPAAFTQCAGFLRIKDSQNPLDNTPVHPESYELAETIIKDLGFSLTQLNDKATLEAFHEKLALVDAETVAANLEAGVPTVRDILEALAKPGRDPREDLPAPMTRKHVMSLEDVKVGTVVKGTVHNVVDFGAFVDFGLKVNGLLHRSEFCRRNEHPSDVLAVGDIIEAEIISVEPARNRIGLSMKSLRNKGNSQLGKSTGEDTKIQSGSENRRNQRNNKNHVNEAGSNNRRNNQQNQQNSQNRRNKKRNEPAPFVNNNITIVYSKKK